MLDALAGVSPGRPLREGLDRILQAGMGALVVVGDGPVSDALAGMAVQLGWSTTVAATLAEATAALPSARAVVVTSHDDEVDAAAIGAALDAGVEYRSEPQAMFSPSV